MKINGKDVWNYMARQCQVKKGHLVVSNASTWAAKSLGPVFFENDVGMKPLTIVMSVKGEGREGIKQNTSNLLASLLEPVELELDGFQTRFYGTLKSHSIDETSMRRWHTLTLNFEGIEYGPEQTAKKTGMCLVVRNTGNLRTPCIIEILPESDLASLQISVSGRVFTVSNLTAGTVVIVDGENGLFTESGINKFPEMEISEVPYLDPGENRIEVNNEVTLTVKHKPLYM